MKKFFLMFAVIFTMQVQIVNAELVRVYDSGVYTLTQTLEKNGMPLTFIKKSARDNVSAVTLYDYFPNFDENILIGFAVNDEGYISDVTMMAHSENEANLKSVTLQILKAFGISQYRQKDIIYGVEPEYFIMSECNNRYYSVQGSEENGILCFLITAGT